MKSDNYVVIQGWMCNELELKGNELLVFALINGFSQDDISNFSGGRTYIANTFNISLPTVDKALNGLLEKNYIIKQSSGDYVHTDMYKVNTEVVKKLYEGVVKKLYEGSKETLHSNIINNKNKKQLYISKDIYNTESGNFQFGGNRTSSTKPTLYSKCVNLIDDFTNDNVLREKLIQALKLFIDNSKESGKPFYTNHFKGKLNELRRLSSDHDYLDTDVALKIVNQTLLLGYNGFYPLRDTRKQSTNLHDRLNESGSAYVEHTHLSREERKQGEKF